MTKKILRVWRHEHDKYAGMDIRWCVAFERDVDDVYIYVCFAQDELGAVKQFYEENVNVWT